MEKQKLDRIGELSRKSRSMPLSPEEKKEQMALRNEYLAEMRGSMKSILDNTYIQSPDGTKKKLEQKPFKKNLN